MPLLVKGCRCSAHDCHKADASNVVQGYVLSRSPIYFVKIIWKVSPCSISSTILGSVIYISILLKKNGGGVKRDRYNPNCALLMSQKLEAAVVFPLQTSLSEYNESSYRCLESLPNICLSTFQNLRVSPPLHRPNHNNMPMHPSTLIILTHIHVQILHICKALLLI